MRRRASATTSTPAGSPRWLRSFWSRKSRSTECAASTRTGAIAMTAPFDPGRGYGLNPTVALRPEPFGALAYHFGNRRLSFLKAPELVEGVRRRASPRCLSEALAAVPEGRRDAYLRALASLAAADMIVPQQARSEVARRSPVARPRRPDPYPRKK